jgi:hypothetical protein
MADKTPLQKMGVKPGQSILILNAPAATLDKLGAPTGTATKTKAGAKFDVVSLFATDQAELGKHLKDALASLSPGGMLWLAYPKISSKVKTDITRDKGWDAVVKAGFVGVALVSVDDTWSAMRFRPEAETKSTRARGRV